MPEVQEFIQDIYDACEVNIDVFTYETNDASTEFKELSAMTGNYLSEEDFLTEEEREKVLSLHQIFEVNVHVDWLENNPKDQFAEICKIINSIKF